MQYFCENMLYYRRKILLALLELLGGQLTAKQIQKYLFLFCKQQTTKAFHFVPYYYGCFSFQAQQDIYTLSIYGYLTNQSRESGDIVTLKEQNNRYISNLNIFDQHILYTIKDDYGNLSQDELIKYTYLNYPYYAINSIIASDLLTDFPDQLNKIKLQKERIHKDEAHLFTIGYEGVSLEEYLNKLIILDIHTLCDVRKNAYSQKYGFSKAQLSKACKGVGIKYVHIPDLGIDSDKRQTLNSQKDYDILFDEYEKTTLKENISSLQQVLKIIYQDKRVALTCFEKDPKQCHRSCVAKGVLKLDGNIPFDAIVF